MPAKYYFTAEDDITREDDHSAWEFGINRLPLNETGQGAGEHYRRYVLYDWDKEVGIRERDALIAFMNSSTHFNGGLDA